MKKNKLAAIIGIGALSVCAFLGGALINVSKADATVGDVFDYAQATGTIRYKAYQSDPADSTAQKGLLLYAYDSGASVPFKTTFDGTFTAQLAAAANEELSVALKRYSLCFEDVTTGQEFSVVVSTHSSSRDVAVCYNGELAGIHYYEGTSTQAYGLTGEYNAVVT